MDGQSKSPRSDTGDETSSTNDVHRKLSHLLLEARTRKHLTQQQLAEKLGYRQRQISDLERARTDPRLSTIQNVARALDLELVLIPRHLITTVQGLLRAGSDSATRPMYALGDEETAGSPDSESHTEVGDTGALGIAKEPHTPMRKEPR
jgi:transcriptional regulator with XRE-family HTH domain